MSALSCLACAAASLALLHEITLGFEHWTFESRRRELAAQGQIQAPAFAALAGPGTAVHIVDFIYTRCSTLCQVLGSEYQRMQAQLIAEPAAGVRLLSISFDLQRDDAAALGDYAWRHGAREPVWRVLAPASAAQDQALRSTLGLIAVPDGLGGFVHNGALHLIDANGKLLAIYDYGDWRQALEDARRRTASP